MCLVCDRARLTPNPRTPAKVAASWKQTQKKGHRNGLITVTIWSQDIPVLSCEAMTCDLTGVQPTHLIHCCPTPSPLTAAWDNTASASSHETSTETVHTRLLLCGNPRHKTSMTPTRINTDRNRVWKMFDTTSIQELIIHAFLNTLESTSLVLAPLNQF